MTDLTVSRTILEQLGGRRLIAMTGARDFIGSENALTFKLPSRFAKNGINCVRVTLEPSDTYKVEFLHIHALKVTIVSEHEDIYCDMLQELFERETGLCLSLGRMRA